jgi:hypothetical protein
VKNSHFHLAQQNELLDTALEIGLRIPGDLCSLLPLEDAFILKGAGGGVASLLAPVFTYSVQPLATTSLPDTGFAKHSRGWFFVEIGVDRIKSGQLAQ